ncbi:hypothetical protein HPB49_000901 [Dermacentor silvarum]|uniref:Uncharacterized protein n=1 Tax=Dermacentor silvarum TaxID=543639 RepID=A0ACB8DM39_DERSI|nr:hypothetical protein HPB49_000901 [Dermacentor silvarum]
MLHLPGELKIPELPTQTSRRKQTPFPPSPALPSTNNQCTFTAILSVSPARECVCRLVELPPLRSRRRPSPEPTSRGHVSTGCKAFEPPTDRTEGQQRLPSASLFRVPPSSPARASPLHHHGTGGAASEEEEASGRTPRSPPYLPWRTLAAGAVVVACTCLPGAKMAPSGVAARGVWRAGKKNARPSIGRGGAVPFHLRRRHTGGTPAGIGGRPGVTAAWLADGAREAAESPPNRLAAMADEQETGFSGLAGSPEPTSEDRVGPPAPPTPSAAARGAHRWVAARAL